MNALLQLLVPASLLFAAPSPDTPVRAEKANKMQRLDADGSGTLSASEVAGTKLESRFAAVDSNGDGELTRDEMRAAREARKADKDRDHRARAKGERHGESKSKSKSKSFAKGKKHPRKAKKQALKKDERGGKKAFAKRSKNGNDRKRFAQRGRKNAT